MKGRTGRKLALSQGIFFAASGAWPLVHMRSFERVTGPKTDKWLVRTVGTLLGVIGGVLATSAMRHHVRAETAVLAAGAAAGLATMDAVHVAKGRISTIYLADAAVQSGLVALWMRALAG